MIRNARETYVVERTCTGEFFLSVPERYTIKKEVKFVSNFRILLEAYLCVPMPKIAKDPIAINCWISSQPLRAICTGRLQ